METQQSTQPGEPTWVQTIRSWNLVRSDDRWFAGVAGGIAQRLQIDPLVIRGAMIIVALLSFGAGVVTYLIGWLFLPDSRDGRIAAQDMSTDSRRRNQYIGVILLTAAGLALLSLLGVSFGVIAGPLVGFLVLAGIGFYFLFRRSDDASPSSSDVGDAPSTTAAFTARAVPVSPASTPQASSAISTDTTHVAPFTAPTTTVTRRRSIGGTGFALTLGLSMLLLAGLLIARHYDAFHLPTAPVWLMGSLVIAGAIIVIGGLLGRTSGAVGFFAVLGVMAAPFVAIFGSGPVMHPDADIVWFGNSTQVISESADIQDGYGVVAGNLTVDLTDLDTSEAEGPLTVPLSVVAGELNVIVGDHDVAVIYSVQAGTLESSVPHLKLDRSGIRITDGRAGFKSDGTDPDIILDLRVTAGSANLEVTR